MTSLAGTTDDLSHRTLIARQIVLEAGKFARGYFLDRDRMNVSTKGTQDWVTNVDVDVEALIRRRLKAAFPDDIVLGEEDGQSAESSTGTMWIVDPIDGTTCFMLGIPQWCVVLAYVVRTQPVVAAIYDPMADELYSATQSGGAMLNNKPIRCSDAQTVAAGLVSIGASHMSDPGKSGRFMADLVGDGGMYLRIGACALALCYVACGRLLAAYEPLVSPWDDLAGMLIVREAGGTTSDYPARIVTNKRHPVLSAAPAIWPRVRQLL